jgi:opacity protein-like surface antigen
MNKGKKALLLSLICLGASFSAVAASDDQAEVKEQPAATPATPTVTPQLYHENHFELALAGGIAGVHTRDSHMQVTNAETDILAQTNSYRWDAAEGQLGLGYVYYFVDGPRLSDELRWFPTFETMLNLYYANLGINGDVYRFNSVLLNDTRYQTTVKNTRLMLDGVLAIVSKCNYSIHALLGVGRGWSHVSYRDKMDGNLRIDLNNESESNVVWEIGAGVDYSFSGNFRMSLEYLFTDLGRMRLSSNGVTYNIIEPQISGAKFQVTTQAVLLGLNWALC